MPGDVPDPASWVAGATKLELERLLRRADRYRSIAIVKGYRTVKILWPTDDCSKSSRLYKREYMAISATFGVIC